MKFLTRAKKFLAGATRTIATLSLVFCLDGAVLFCFCNDDPDGCGEHCHECTNENDEACVHVTVQVDAPVVPQSDIDIPVVTDDTVCAPVLAVSPFRDPPVPVSAAPPDCGGRYISGSTRLYPRS